MARGASTGAGISRMLGIFERGEERGAEVRLAA